MSVGPPSPVASSPGWPPTLISVLTAVVPGREDDLAEQIAALGEGDSFFAGLASTHLARLVVVGQLPRLPGMPRTTHRLLMRYLLLSVVADSTPAGFFEELRTLGGDSVDTIWFHCVGYPGRDDARAFGRYLTRNLVPAQQTYAAYDATVPEILEALALRTEHACFAVGAQELDSVDELQARFCEHFDVGGGPG